MELITTFTIKCYHDIAEEYFEINNKIPVPMNAPKPITFVFDEDKSVRWNRQQVELYNKQNSELRKEAVDLRRQSYENLDRAVIDYMEDFEALDSTPREVIAKVVARAQFDHDDDWWNYLSDYLEFAEDILEAASGVDLCK